jgi:hypothetical protein
LFLGLLQHSEGAAVSERASARHLAVLYAVHGTASTYIYPFRRESTSIVHIVISTQSSKYPTIFVLLAYVQDPQLHGYYPHKTRTHSPHIPTHLSCTKSVASSVYRRRIYSKYFVKPSYHVSNSPRARSSCLLPPWRNWLARSTVTLAGIERLEVRAFPGELLFLLSSVSGALRA